MVLGRCASDCIVSSMGWLGPREASLSVSVGTEILRFFDGGIIHRNPNNDARCLVLSTIEIGKVDKVEHGIPSHSQSYPNVLAKFTLRYKGICHLDSGAKQWKISRLEYLCPKIIRRESFRVKLGFCKLRRRSISRFATILAILYLVE